MGRVSNSIKNTISGFGLQAITAVLAFITRSAMINALGIESVAINGLFSEVISALTLADLGVGSAIVYNLYKPLAEGNTKKVNQLMTLFRQAYIVIAAAIMTIGIILCPWIQHLVNGMEYELWYLRVVYLLFVFQCASSYLFAYKVSLLNADQKSREVAWITALVKIIGTLVQIAVLYLTRRYICFLLVSIVITVTTNISVSVRVDRIYPYLKAGDSLPNDEKRTIFSNVKNIFFKQLAGKVVNSTDNILISTLVNTIMVGYYANYLSVIGMMKQLVDQVTGGITASMGNLFVSENKERCELIFFRLEYAFRWMALIFSVCTYGCIQIFISLWVGNTYLLDDKIILWCCINMYCSMAINPLSTAMHLIGRFDIGRNISICSAVVNLIVSILLGIQWGMIGIFIGTFATYLIEFFAKNYYLYKLFFQKSCREAVLKGVISFTATIILFTIEYVVKQKLVIAPTIIAFLIAGFICAVISILMIVITAFRTEAFQYWLQFAGRLIRNRRKS